MEYLSLSLSLSVSVSVSLSLSYFFFLFYSTDIPFSEILEGNPRFDLVLYLYGIFSTDLIWLLCTSRVCPFIYAFTMCFLLIFHTRKSDLLDVT